VSWKHEWSNWIGGIGHWNCAEAPPYLEEQVAIFVIVGKGKTATKSLVGQSKGQVFKYPGYEGVTEGATHIYKVECKTGERYQVRAWARTWDAFTGKTNWVGKSYDGHTEKCPAKIDPDVPDSS
jgi:hypothetical protein